MLPTPNLFFQALVSIPSPLYNCLPVTASVEVAEISPSPTLTIFLFKVAEPTETVLLPPEVELSPKTTDLVIPAPIATLLPKIKLSSEPLAILFLLPIIYELLPSFIYSCSSEKDVFPTPKAPEELPVTAYLAPKAELESPITLFI